MKLSILFYFYYTSLCQENPRSHLFVVCKCLLIYRTLNHNLDTNDALHYYKSENVITGNGVLNITTNFQENKYVAFNEKTKKKYADSKYIQSGMVQGWNKFCFTGGIVEIKAKLPGKHDVGGLWPARES